MTGIIEMKIFAEFVGTDGVLARREVFVVRRNVDQPHLKDFGLTVDLHFKVRLGLLEPILAVLFETFSRSSLN